jgi:hypothetical protein
MTAFLADENCDSIVVYELRSIGFDVTYVAELAPGETDANILTRHYRRSGFYSPKIAISVNWFFATRFPLLVLY